MVLVDTTVWIDFFAGRDEAHVGLLESLLVDGEDVAICGFVLTEVLQGIRSDAQYRMVRENFQTLILLPMLKDNFIQSADIYKRLRKKGITVRKMIDCMIAAIAIENKIPLLHNDMDYEQIARHTALKTVKMK